jgi:hypothetical protein
MSYLVVQGVDERRLGGVFQVVVPEEAPVSAPCTPKDVARLAVLERFT